MKKNSKNNSQQATTQQKKGQWTMGKVIKKTGQIILGIGAGALAIEATASAAGNTVADVKAGIKYVDFKRNPKKYTCTIKTGLFKKETVLINPVTGSVTKMPK